MFASVRHYKGVPDPSQLGQLVQDDFVPILKQHQGFVAYYWVDSGDNEMVSMSVIWSMISKSIGASMERPPPALQVED